MLGKSTTKLNAIIETRTTKERNDSSLRETVGEYTKEILYAGWVYGVTSSTEGNSR